MATALRPNVKRYTEPEWYTNNFNLCTDAEKQRHVSHQTVQNGRHLRNETDSKTTWDQYSNNVRLGDRIDDLRKWKEIMEERLASLDHEIINLSEAKGKLENLLEAMATATDTVVENLTIREGRQGINVVEDDVEKELNKEREVINGCKKALQEKIGEAFEQLCVLQETRQKVQEDIHDKGIAVCIDVDQYNMTNQSSYISYKPDCLHMPKGSIGPEEWADFSRRSKEKAEAEIRASTRLREAAQFTTQKNADEFETQKTATEYAFRKRIYEWERSIDQLLWQKKNTEDDIAEIENDIRGLKEAIRLKMYPAKLAQTRLENRTYRPNMEMCCDAPQTGLMEEVKQVEVTIEALEEELKKHLHVLDGLQKTIHRIKDDLDDKNHCLMLDKRCMDIREKLNPYPQTSYQKSLNVTGIPYETPGILV